MEVELIPWKNRASDRKSDRLLAIQIVIAVSIVSVLGSIAMLLFNVHGWVIFIAVCVWLTSAIGMYKIGRIYNVYHAKMNQRVVPTGYKALIYFNRRMTGEIANSGPLIIPYGYHIQPEDCRVYEYEYGPSDVRSRDNFIISASINSSISEDIPLRSGKHNDPESFINNTLKYALNSSISTTEALRVVAMTDDLSESAKGKIQKELGQYGFKVIRVGIFIDKVPESIIELNSIVSQIRNEFPKLGDREVINFVLDYTSKGGGSTESVYRSVVGAIRDYIDGRPS